MSGSVTPQRRNRDDVEDNEEDLYGSSPKRARRNDEAEGDDVIEDQNDRSPSPQQPLLPDSFRRSPRGPWQQDVPRKHQPGSLVRITMNDFVTYTRAQFNPGPNLNMIVGPNGTGKSTLVCAICLGLGWKPSHLGRAKDIGEFVKHGAKRATIEIELAADPRRHASNPVITTRIIREGNKTEFAIDCKKVSKKEVDTLMRSFSIQVDNLCQFLPQDRVVEFAALSPVDLLTHTQRAAAPPQMSEWHEQLKTMRKEQKARLNDQQALIDELKNKEQRQAQQQEIVERLRERSELQHRASALEQMRPFPQYKAAKARHLKAKERKKEAESELKLLHRQVQPNLRAEEDKKLYLENVEAVVLKRSKMVERLDKMAADKKKEMNDKQDRIDKCKNDIDNEKKSASAARSTMPGLLQTKSKLERSLQNPPAQVDFAAYNEKGRDITRQIRELRIGQGELSDETSALTNQILERRGFIERAEAEQQSLQTQAGQQASKLRNASREAAQAWEWIQRHRHRFQSDVYGPPIIECTAKDPKYAAAVESACGQGELLAFTVTSRADFAALQKALYDELRLDNINIRQSEQRLDTFRPPCSHDQLQHLGLESFIVNLIEGPEPVLAMLCDNRNLHATAFTSHELNNARLDVLKSQNSPISSWVTPSEAYSIIRRREYGDRGTSVRTNALKPGRFFTDAPSSHNEDAELTARVEAANREIASLDERRLALFADRQGLSKRLEQLEKQEKELKDEKNQKQALQAHFAALPTKLANSQRKIDDTTNTIRSSAEKCREIAREGDEATLEKGQAAINYAIAVNNLREHLVQHIESQIVVIEARSELEQLLLRTREERELLEQRQREVQMLDAEMKALLEQGKRLRDICKAIIFEDELTQEIYNEEVSNWDEVQLESEIESVRARLELHDGAGNQHIIQEFEKRAKIIDEKKRKLADVEELLGELEDQIKEIKEQWEPQLDELIAKISEAFAENFGKIQCAGEVGVHKNEDFENWAIQIKVKFRETESLSLLDAHRQSGGERAVSTIFYLMALQSLARAPFRVVDEINQGMDPRNERMVHSRMVEIAQGTEGGNGGSQYFLITPKLLPGLRYERGMKVHCIASGEFMPDQWEGLDFGALAKKALVVKGRRNEGTA